MQSDLGRWALVKGDTVVDTFGVEVDAIRQGYRNFGVGPFLVKQILPIDPVETIL